VDCTVPDGSAPIPLDFTVQGALTAKGPVSFAIDACANVDCKMADVYEATLDIAGISVGIPEGAYVELAYHRGRVEMYDCSYSAWIRNIPSLQGIANPTEDGNALWVEGVVAAPHASAPVQFQWLYGNESCKATQLPPIFGCDPPAGLDIILSAVDDASKNVRLSMGETAVWDVGTAALPGRFTAKNLASVNLVETSDLSYVVARATSP